MKFKKINYICYEILCRYKFNCTVWAAHPNRILKKYLIMALKVKKPSQVVVLNTVQALAADVQFTNGKLWFNDGTRDLSEPFKVGLGVSWNYSPYNAGTPSVKQIDFAGVSLTPQTEYVISIELPGRVDPATQGGREANQLFAVRTYIIYSGVTSFTATQLRDAFVAKINADLGRGVNAAQVGATAMSLTLRDVNDGDFNITALPSGATTTVTTPYAAPVGVYEEVKQIAPNLVNPSGQYNRFEIVYHALRNHNAVSGGKALFEERINVYIESTDANAAALVTEVSDILSGTHTPVSDYLGL